MFTGTLDCAYKTVKNEVCEDVERDFQFSSHCLLSPSLTISHHLLSPSPLIISHHLLLPSPLTISHHLSPSPLTISHHLSYRLLSLYLSPSLTISSHPKSPPHCFCQLPSSLVHLHTLTIQRHGSSSIIERSCSLFADDDPSISVCWERVFLVMWLWEVLHRYLKLNL